MAVKAIDVSSYNGNIDFNKVKAAGVEDVIIRCGFTGYGARQSLNKDDYFETNYKKAKEAGLRVGAYYYAVALTQADADREAAFVLSLLKGKQFELPIYYDVEDAHDTSASGVLKESMASIGKTRLTQIVDRFCSTVEKAGYFVGIYAGKYWLDAKLDMSVLNRYTVWVAHWVNKTDYQGPYAAWQYTDSGRVNGVPGNVDMNMLYMDFTTPIKRLGLNGFTASNPAPTPEPVPEPPVLIGDVDGDGDVDPADARKVLRAAVGLETLTDKQKTAADTDGDGKITAADARTVLRKATGLED